MKNILILITIISSFLFSQNKLFFDVSKTNCDNFNNLLTKINTDSDEINNTYLSATILNGGYYTIGTASGLSSDLLDDNCDITFGHPYAKTSFPLFSIDGNWYKLDEYFSPSELTLNRNADTLEVAAIKSTELLIKFFICFSVDGQAVILNQTIKNLDSISHSIAIGFSFDPALGKWGDGYLEIQPGYLKNNKMFDSAAVPEKVTLWEKSFGVKGIGIELSFQNEKPLEIVAANWKEIYETKKASVDTTQVLYDLFLKFYWQETELLPNEEKSCQLKAALKSPDFSSQLFLRWDLQSFLGLQNNIVFPNGFDTYLTVNKTTSSSISNANIKLELPSSLTSNSSEIYIALGNQSYYQKINFRSHIIYEDKVEEVIAKIFSDNQLIDELHREVFIPATPVSDTGLTVSIDNIDESKFPKIEFKFEAKINSNDYKISNLSSENIFLYEDDNRIMDFNLGHDTTGGLNAADIIFVLDVTGSMSDEIDEVKNNIIEFADSLSYRGIDYRLGMVTFLDVIENIYPFTTDVQYFQSLVSQQHAHGGADEPENSLQALIEATKYPFRQNANRVVIWITDATYHENDTYTSLTKNDVITALLSMGLIVHAIGPESNKSSYYDPIIIPTGGNFYDIYGNFRDILLDISRFYSSSKYVLSYQSLSSQLPAEIKLQIRYAGLGGEAIVFPIGTTFYKSSRYLAFYPNPFNPQITFNVEKGNYLGGELRIFNLLGQLIKTINIDNNTQSIIWSAQNDNGDLISAGLYIVQLVLNVKNELQYFETAKILYLK